jgi:hypothetical protein
LTVLTIKKGGGSEASLLSQRENPLFPKTENLQGDAARGRVSCQLDIRLPNHEAVAVAYIADPERIGWPDLLS